LLDAASRMTERRIAISESSETRAEAAFEMRPDLLLTLHFPNPASRLHMEFIDSESGLFGSGTMQEGLVFNSLWELEYPLYFAEIQTPVFVIAGIEDSTSYPSQTDWLVDLLQAELFELETGHYPWFDDTEVFIKALETALES
jgi:proline iminopeptidase